MHSPCIALDESFGLVHTQTSQPLPAGASMMDDTARLNHLDREQESQDSDSSVTERLDRWLAMVIQRGASDLLLVSGAPPCMRVNGEVRKIEPGLLDGPEIEAAVVPALPRSE